MIPPDTTKTERFMIAHIIMHLPPASSTNLIHLHTPKELQQCSPHLCKYGCKNHTNPKMHALKVSTIVLCISVLPQKVSKLISAFLNCHRHENLYHVMSDGRRRQFRFEKTVSDVASPMPCDCSPPRPTKGIKPPAMWLQLPMQFQISAMIDSDRSTLEPSHLFCST
jgi:hypothetical protein